MINKDKNAAQEPAHYVVLTLFLMFQASHTMSMNLASSSPVCRSSKGVQPRTSFTLRQL